MRWDCRICEGRAIQKDQWGGWDACGACTRVAEAAWRAAQKARAGGTSAPARPDHLAARSRAASASRSAAKAG